MLKCPECKKEFRNLGTLKRHFQYKHYDNYKFCKKCNKPIRDIKLTHYKLIKDDYHMLMFTLLRYYNRYSVKSVKQMRDEVMKKLRSE
jgi:hypothetical protein